MSFQIPEDLSQFSISGLQDLGKQAKAEYDTLIASLSADTCSDDDLDYAEALQTFHRVTVPEELEGRKSRSSRFSVLTEEPKTQPDEPEPDGEEDEPAAVTASSSEVIKVNLSDIVDRAPEPNLPAASERPRYSTLVAAAGVPNYSAGQHLDTMLDVAKAFEARSASHGAVGNRQGQGPIMYPVAQLVRDYPAEFSVDGDATDYAKLLAVADEKRLPGGSLLRSAEIRRKEILAEDPTRDLLAPDLG